VLHHVSLEVPPDQIERSAEFWELLGFERIDAPEPIAGFVSWFEQSQRTTHAAFATKAAHQQTPTQIHLLHSTDPTVPRAGHAAVVAGDFQTTVERLREAGFEVDETRALWGERRAFARAPGGHLVELMAAPPAPSA
jgi:catechol 2,3-dioxygenase-like lactoylglutathione lyase family enzyme